MWDNLSFLTGSREECHRRGDLKGKENSYFGVVLGPSNSLS